MDDYRFRIGTLFGLDWAERADLKMPGSEFVEITSLDDFFSGNNPDLDAITISAEAGSAWTVVYPEYAVAIPKPHIKRPIAIATLKGEHEFTEFLSNWIQLQKTDGTLDRLYHRWILGKGATKEGVRWSVMKDVLHWVD